jgi:hypothetical protein
MLALMPLGVVYSLRPNLQIILNVTVYKQKFNTQTVTEARYMYIMKHFKTRLHSPSSYVNQKYLTQIGQTFNRQIRPSLCFTKETILLLEW